MINYIIVDDEPIAHRIIEGYASSLPYLTKHKNCYNALEALDFLKDNVVDLIFLDINMPRLKGFDFLKTIQNPPQIIVTTAYSEYALEGYELNVSDYLVKPFGFERFLKAVNKIVSQQKESHPRNNISKNELENNHEYSDSKIFLKGDKKHFQIDRSEILFIEAYGNYTKLYLKDKQLLIHEGISALASKLNDTNFVRVHKSYIVSQKSIEIIEGNTIKILDHKIPIGQTYRSKISEMLKK